MFVVEIHGPDGESRRIEFDVAEATVGRVAGNDIVLAGDTISKRHARIVERDDAMVLVDLKSANGTYVNGRRMTSPLVVAAHDVITIGDHRLFVQCEDVEPTTEWPLPAYLARDAVERQLLAEIAERDDAARVVYADWLEARGELGRAEFLRVQQDILECGPDEPRLEELSSRLRALARSIDLRWRARVARPAVEGCPVAFELSCPKEWGKLQATEQDRVRYCGSCEKTVHYASSVTEARRHARLGHCVAVDVGELRWDRDLDPPYGRFVCSSCHLDVGPSVLDCPSCGTSIRRPMVMMGAMMPPDR